MNVGEMTAPPSPDPTNDNPAYESPDPERPASASPAQGELDANLQTGLLRHDPYAALRYRDYRIYSAGWMLAVIGNQIAAAALAWEVFDLMGAKSTRDGTLALGILAGIQALPLIVLALPAGVIADVFDRRRVIAASELLAAICAIGLALLPYERRAIPWIYAILFFSSCFLILGRPARSSLLPMIVPPAVFTNAVTWNSSIFQVASMAGPALGGLVIAQSLIHFHSVRIAYLVDAICGIAFAASMLLVKQVREGRTNADTDTPILQRLMAGIHFVRNTRIILATMTLDLFAVLLGGAVYLLPLFAKDRLHVGAVGYGWLRAAEAIGALAMAMLIAHLPPMKHAGRTMLLAVAGFGAATVVFGLSTSFGVSFSMLFIIGAFDNVSVVVRHTLVQVLTPDEMRGAYRP